jgi:hypothetical protein
MKGDALLQENNLGYFLAFIRCDASFFVRKIEHSWRALTLWLHPKASQNALNIPEFFWHLCYVLSWFYLAVVTIRMPLHLHLRHCYFVMEFQMIVRSNSNPRYDTHLSLDGNFSPDADAQIAQRQGAKAALKPVPSNVLSMFERAVEEQVSCFLLFASTLRPLIPFAETRLGRSAACRRLR